MKPKKFQKVGCQFVSMYWWVRKWHLCFCLFVIWESGVACGRPRWCNSLCLPMAPIQIQAKKSRQGKICSSCHSRSSRCSSCHWWSRARFSPSTHWSQVQDIWSHFAQHPFWSSQTVGYRAGWLLKYPLDIDTILTLTQQNTHNVTRLYAVFWSKPLTPT